MTTKWVVKVFNSAGLEIGQMPSNRWSVLEVNDDLLQEGDRVVFLRPYKEFEDANIKQEDKEAQHDN